MNLEMIQKKLTEYENADLLALFLVRLDFPSLEAAKEGFKELKKLLLLCFLVQEKKIALARFDILERMNTLDEMWHLFILMTKDYSLFCERVFGVYVHHSPEIPTAIKSEDKKFPTGPLLTEQIEAVINLFGPETAVKWYTNPKANVFSKPLKALKKLQWKSNESRKN